MDNKCTRCGGNHREAVHAIQSYGEQHHAFHSKEMKAYRSEDKAKAKALKKKVGTADHINAERKRQGHKPMSAKDKRIHEGMDKYL